MPMFLCYLGMCVCLFMLLFAFLQESVVLLTGGPGRAVIPIIRRNREDAWWVSDDLQCWVLVFSVLAWCVFAAGLQHSFVNILADVLLKEHFGVF